MFFILHSSAEQKRDAIDAAVANRVQFLFCFNEFNFLMEDLLLYIPDILVSKLSSILVHELRFRDAYLYTKGRYKKKKKKEVLNLLDL